MLPDVQAPVAIEAARMARIVQIHDRPVSMSMLAYAGSNGADQDRSWQRRADLHAIALSTAAAASPVLAVTYKAAAPEP